MNNYYIAPKNKLLLLTTILYTVIAAVSVFPVLFMLTLGTAFAAAAPVQAQLIYFCIFIFGSYCYVFLGFLWYFYANGVPQTNKKKFAIAVGALLFSVLCIFLVPYIEY